MSYRYTTPYRYGFNGKRSDPETYNSSGNEYDYGFRIFNPRLGRFLSVDPLTKKYPWYTPYQFAGNKPIWAVDLDGLEEWFVSKIYNFDNSKITLAYRYNSGHAGEGVLYQMAKIHNGIYTDLGCRNVWTNSNFMNPTDKKSVTGPLPYYVSRSDQSAGTNQQMGPLGKDGVNVAQGQWHPILSGDKVKSAEAWQNFPTLTEYYNTDKASSGSESFDVAAISKFLVENPDLNIVVRGFTDREGGDADNCSLSENRALNLKNAIIKSAISQNLISEGQSEEFAKRITTDGAGETGAQNNGDADGTKDASYRKTEISVETNDCE